MSEPATSHERAHASAFAAEQAGYKQTLGADSPPTCYDDVNHADCIFIVGSNTAFAHPILFRRIEDAKKANPETVSASLSDKIACGLK